MSANRADFAGDFEIPVEPSRLGKLQSIQFSSRTEKLAELGGYAGMALLQGATLPTTIPLLLGYNATLPPLSLVLMVWVGLILYFVRALVRFDFLYLISNGIGIALNFILLIIIVFRG